MSAHSNEHPGHQIHRDEQRRRFPGPDVGSGRKSVLVHGGRRVRVRRHLARLFQRHEDEFLHFPADSGDAAGALRHLRLRISAGQTSGLRHGLS